MHKLISLFLLLVCLPVIGQDRPVPVTTPYTKGLLKAVDDAAARTILGVALTNGVDTNAAVAIANYVGGNATSHVAVVTNYLATTNKAILITSNLVHLFSNNVDTAMNAASNAVLSRITAATNIQIFAGTNVTVDVTNGTGYNNYRISTAVGGGGTGNVTVDGSGVLTSPTNLFFANSNAMRASIAPVTLGGIADLLGSGTNTTLYGPILNSPYFSDGTIAGYLKATPHTTNRWAVTHPQNTNFYNQAVFAGHSFVAGHPGLNYPWPFWLTNLYLTNFFPCTNIGVDGSLARDMDTNFVNSIKPFRTRDGTNGWLFLETGLNDLWAATPTNAAVLWGVVSNTCYAAHSNNMFVVIFTEPFANTLTEPDTNRMAYNALIRANPSMWDYLIDLERLVDVSLFTLDGATHPNDDSSRLIADLIYRSLAYDGLLRMAISKYGGSTNKDWTGLLQPSMTTPDLTQNSNRLDLPINGDPFGSLTERPLKMWAPWAWWYTTAQTWTNVSVALVSNILTRWSTNGMRAAGFDTLCLEDCMFDWTRDGNGYLQGNSWKGWSSNEIYLLCNDAHSKGMKLWVNCSYNTNTLAGLPGTTDAYVEKDIKFYADCGLDGVYLNAGTNVIANPESYYKAFWRVIPNALTRQSRKMQLGVIAPNVPDQDSIGVGNFHWIYTPWWTEAPAVWMTNHPSRLLWLGFAHQMRTNVMNAIVNRTEESIVKYFNRPDHSIHLFDMGRTSFWGVGGTLNDWVMQMKCQYTLNTMFNAPMRVGFFALEDAGFPTTADTNVAVTCAGETHSVFWCVTNRWAAEISADSGWNWPKCAESNALSEMWYKDLADDPGARAVFIWNYDFNGANSSNIFVDFGKCGFLTNRISLFEVRDVWGLSNYITGPSFTFTIRSNACAMLKVKPYKYDAGLQADALDTFYIAGRSHYLMTSRGWDKCYGMGTGTNSYDRCLFFGDSWLGGAVEWGSPTNMYYQPMPYYWTNWYWTNLSYTWNYGVPGFRCYDVYTNFQHRLSDNPWYAGGSDTNAWLFNLAGFNDLWNQSNALRSFHFYSNTLYMARSNNIYTVAYTLPKTREDLTLSYSTNRLAFNDLIRTNTSLWDVLVDLDKVWYWPFGEYLTNSYPGIHSHPDDMGSILLADLTIGAFKQRAYAGTVSGGGSGVSALNDLMDVNTGAPNDGDILTWDFATGFWIASSPPSGTANTNLYVAAKHGYGTNNFLHNPSFTNGVNYGNAFISLGAGTESLQLGDGATASGANSIAVGPGAEATALNSTAIGNSASAQHVDSLAFGPGVSTTAAGEIRIGQSTNTVVMPGTMAIGNLNVTGAMTVTNWSTLIITNSVIKDSHATNLTLWGSIGGTNRTFTDSQGWHNTNHTTLGHVDIASGNITTSSNITYSGQLVPVPVTSWWGPQSQSTNYVLDLSYPEYDLTCTNDVCFIWTSSTNRATTTGNVYVTVGLFAGGSQRNLSFNSNWKWLGTTNNPPTALASGKVGILSLRCNGTTETNIWAAFAAQP